ncbi:MAG: inositol monophosphatase [Micavibrio sp.]|nr:inositol monophosphatase [Micavibrio sp.]
MNVMIRAAEKAGRSLVRDFGEVENLQVSVKGPGDFVSAADKRSEKIIFEELKKAKPGYSFLMEESGRIEGEDKDHVWVVDPLDGTTNFLHGLPHWCISIALVDKGEVTLGLIYDPIKDDLFTAERGKGAFHRRRRLRVSGRRNFPMTAIATGAPMRTIQEAGPQFIKEYNAIQELGAGMRRFGAAALDLAYVASGKYDGFWERNLKPWDVAAGILLVKEAGGFVCDLDKDSNDALKTGNILAANEYIYNDMKKVLRK